MSTAVQVWNLDKPHRCPACHTCTNTAKPSTWRAVYECCGCGARFARWPWLARILPVRRCRGLANGTCTSVPDMADDKEVAS